MDPSPSSSVSRLLGQLIFDSGDTKYKKVVIIADEDALQDDLLVWNNGLSNALITEEDKSNLKSIHEELVNMTLTEKINVFGASWMQFSFIFLAKIEIVIVANPTILFF